MSTPFLSSLPLWPRVLLFQFPHPLNLFLDLVTDSLVGFFLNSLCFLLALFTMLSHCHSPLNSRVLLTFCYINAAAHCYYWKSWGLDVIVLVGLKGRKPDQPLLVDKDNLSHNWSWGLLAWSHLVYGQDRHPWTWTLDFTLKRHIHWKKKKCPWLWLF